MKVGAEQKSKLYLLVALLLVGIAAYLWSAGPDTGLSTVTNLGGGAAPKLGDLKHLDPTLRMGELDALREENYEGGDRDLFHFVAPPPPPRPPAPVISPAAAAAAAAAANAPVVPPPPPPPPPLPLRFFGSATPSDGSGSTRVMLMLGDRVYTPKQGDTVEKRYLIEQIKPLSVRAKDLQTGQEQELPLVVNNGG